MKTQNKKASELKVGDSVKFNSMFRVISKVTFTEWKSVASDSLGEKIPMVIVDFSTYTESLKSGHFYINTIVKTRV